MKFILVLALCVFLSGCVTAEQIAQADYGPSPTNVEFQAKSYFVRALKDSESARYLFGRLDKGWSTDLLVEGGKAHFGWIQVVSVNSKNGYGAYTGFQDYYLMFEGGTLIGDVTDKFFSSQGGFVNKD